MIKDDTKDTNSKTPVKAKSKRWPISVAAFFAFVNCYLWFTGVYGGNVRTVDNNRVYRSAQLTGHNLDDVIKGDHIRTIINLRGGSQSDSWYRSELGSCNRYHVTHVDIGMSAEHLPPPEQLQQVLKAFDTAQYPVLFHCKAGSDRSGLVGVLYLAIYKNVPFEKAYTEQLTWRYGHYSFGTAHAMDDFIHLYEKTHGPLKMRDWIMQKYPALYKASH